MVPGYHGTIQYPAGVTYQIHAEPIYIFFIFYFNLQTDYIKKR